MELRTEVVKETSNISLVGRPSGLHVFLVSKGLHVLRIDSSLML